MPAIKYRVKLTDDEVEMLESLLRKGKSAAGKQTRARILLKAATGYKDAAIMEALAAHKLGLFPVGCRCWRQVRFRAHSRLRAALVALTV